MTDDNAPQSTLGPNGTLLAYHLYQPDMPSIPDVAVCFLGGYRSDMEGTKALFLQDTCRNAKIPYLRFDYSGHGRSGGNFADFTIGNWRDDALHMVDTVLSGYRHIVLVGSSMGGWIMLLTALARKDRIAGLVGIAAAPDFTTEMYHSVLNDAQRAELMETGLTHLPNPYSDEPYIITRALIDDGERNNVLAGGIDFDGPVAIINGTADESVPADTAHKIYNAMKNKENTKVHIVDGGDHKLSRPQDLNLIRDCVFAVLNAAAGYEK